MSRTKAAARSAPFPEEPHDHGHCIADALREAERICRGNGVRLTPQRRRVLGVVWGSHQPIGAYAILDALREAGLKAAPPTVYRALEFLLEQGLIHRIESLNAYAGCVRPGTDHTGQFLVCDRCGTVAELDDGAITRSIDRCAARVGFRTVRRTVEIGGLCPHCAGAVR